MGYFAASFLILFDGRLKDFVGRFGCNEIKVKRIVGRVDLDWDFCLH